MPGELKLLAEQLLQQQTDSNNATLGKNWVSTFKQHHPELTSYYSWVMDSQRVLASNPKVVEAYFDLLEDTSKEYNIVLENIYNMDETGFLLGQSQPCNIIVPKENGNRETITMVECISTHGPPPLPMVIFKGKAHQQGWYQDHAAAKDWMFATSPNGWTDNDLALEWLQDCFDKHMQQKAQGKHHLLILDNHSSHVMLDFIQQAWESCIVCLCLPPHATHLLQPLDVSIFGPLQKAFTTEVNKFADANVPISKKDFLGMYIKACQVITGRATAKAFKDVGIDSTLCCEVVLNHMPAFNCNITPPPQLPFPEEPATPSTSVEAKWLIVQLLHSHA
ncbi:related to transposase [Sporisorium scitamineum]|uniref:Related to transposase n=1 Tax=Sporisorium scitamineum TaxID=49012 RepID=A0A127ZAT3_9BASI|nr:related to transposase [Sporisorium scitamineum]